MYRKRYEDSYLDDESEEFDGNGQSDADRIIELLRIESKTDEDEALIKKLIDRLFRGVKMPNPLGPQAVFGIELVAKAYAELGLPDMTASLYERLMQTATETGNSELYYKSMDKIGGLSSETFEEYGGGK